MRLGTEPGATGTTRYRSLVVHLPRAPAAPLASLVIVLAAIAAALATNIRAPNVLVDVPLWLLPVLVVVLVAMPVWMLLTHRHGLALAILLLYLGVADGVLKLQSASEIPGLGRDLLLYAIAIGMLLRSLRRGQPLQAPALTAWVVAFIAVVIVQLANPANGSMLHSLASLRQHLEFIPLFFIGYAVLRSTKRLRVLFTLIALVATANAAVSVVQLGLTPDELATWGPGYAGLINGTSGNSPRTTYDADGDPVVRPPGLGSDMGFGGLVGALAIPGALALVVLAGRRRRAEQALAVLLVVGASVGVATSLSRSAVIATIVGVVAFLAIIGLAQPRRLFAVLAGLGLIVALGTVTILTVTDGKEGDFDRLSSITPSRVIDTTVESRGGTFSLIPVYAEEIPLGAGLGSVGPAARVLDPPPPKGLNAESQFTFLIVELGMPGLLVVLGFTVSVLMLVVVRIRRVRRTDEVLLLAGLAAPLFGLAVLWIVGTNTTSTPNAPYFWLAAGTLSFWLGTALTERANQPPSDERAGELKTVTP